ncbi:MAG: CBS domain-containing protein [Thermoanaerobaculia bacterium]|nr:CBS domain-containing protein [Thermoanaerobaculia bacterium]
MILVTTHVGADFDAFSSTLLARKLHPGGKIFFPGSKEASVRRMLESRGLEHEELRHKEVDASSIDWVILCDIRQKGRIGIVAEWLEERPEIPVVAYDHHDDADDDVEVEGGIVDPGVGATCTLLTEEIRRRELRLEEEEATLLLMGIYEDTGSLSYPTTSPRDMEASGWLLEAGADLSVVRRYALHSLDATHVEILYRMTRALEVETIRGHRVGLVTLSLGSYVPELAPLVSRCLEIFELPLLFALFGEGDRVTVIARGEVSGFHCGEFLEELVGGGGHPSAAAGSSREETILELRERLRELLGRSLPPEATARDLMISPFVSVTRDNTVGEAKRELLEARVNAAPVLDGPRVVGSVTRQLLDAAIQHDLGSRPVTRVMAEELVWARPDLPAQGLGRLMSEHHPRFILVGDESSGRPEGLITRMTLFRHLHGRLEEVAEPLERRTREQKERRKGVGKLLRSQVPEELRRRIEIAAEVAGESDASVYLVGGFVRDLLLRRENRDLDLVVVGDGPAYARRLGDRLEARVRVHEKFLTAKVIESDGFVIDVATARSEFYRQPAALPEVRTSALRHDLYRRDFTINTLAIALGPGEEGGAEFELVDYFGGQRDLDDRQLRVLHSLSFIDDPTRVLRAVRLELRLGFEISPETRRLIDVAVDEGVFERLSGARLRDELVLLLDRPDTAIRGLERLEELEVLGTVHPHLELTPERLEVLRDARAGWEWYRLEGLEEPPVRLWMLFLTGAVEELPAEDREEVGERLQLLQSDRDLLRTFPSRLSRAREVVSRPEADPSDVRRALKDLTGEETLLLFSRGTETVRLRVHRDLVEMRHIELEIGGEELLEKGAEPGPILGTALGATLDARLDGEVEPGREAELEYAWRIYRERDEEPGPRADR